MTSLDSRVGRIEGVLDHIKEDIDRQEALLGQFGRATHTMERITEKLSEVVSQISTVSERLTAVEERLRDETLIRTYRNNHIRNLGSALIVIVMIWSDKLGDAVNQFGELIHRWYR